MEQRRVGRSGLQVSRLALGTMTWGRDTDADEAAAELETFVGAGGTLIDTANIYGDGDAESILGTLIPDVIPRSDVVLAVTTVGTSGRGRLLSALDASLARLGADSVDLWMVHGFDAAVPYEETCSALAAAVDSGRAAYVGVSGHAGWQLATHAACLTAIGHPLVAVQNEYSLLARSVEDSILPAAALHGAGLLGWAPLGRGVLTGKYRHGSPADSRGSAQRWQQFVEPYLDERSTSVVDAVLTAADGLGVSPVAVALAWVRDRPGVVAPIVGARTSAQLQAALAAEEVVLPDVVRSALDDVSEPAVGYPERVPLWSSDDIEF
jgi:aryl-alcohol dehydrogenase-like predicted oxidoreductase